MAFYDYSFGDRNIRYRDENSDLRTGGNWDQIEADRTAAVAKASLLSRNLPSNQPTNAQGMNYLAGLSQQFQPTSNSDFHVDSLLRNPHWNILYSVDPQRANRLYQNATGKSFDQALKDREAQKKFVLETVQGHIANNRLRQGVTGDWEEMQELPDTSPGAMPGATKKSWGTASGQTLDLINRAGGTEALGLSNFSGRSAEQVDEAMKREGYTVDQRKAYISALVAKTAVAPQAALNQIKPASPPSGQVEGLIPFIGRNLGPNGRPAIDPDAVTKEHLRNQVFQDFAAGQVTSAALHNLKSRIFGGQLQPLNPEMTNDEYQKLLILMPH